MYSDISIWIKDSSSPNRNSAKAFAVSVFPTPDGPKNINDPEGLFGSFNPDLVLLIALDTAEIASFWPIILLCNSTSISSNLAVSSWVSLWTGIPVHWAKTSAISSSSITISISSTDDASVVLTSSNKSFSWSLIWAAFSYNWDWTASIFCSLRFLSLSAISCFSWSNGFLYTLIRLPASSIKSIALSGRNLSEIYLSAIFTAEAIAWSVKRTPWCTSYLSFSPSNISMASDNFGSSTWTDWNLLSSAASFSKCFLNSSSVVAPIVWSSPLANIGLRIDAASIAPSAAPAPTRVCISSINNTMSPLVFISLRTFFKRSSKSPL